MYCLKAGPGKFCDLAIKMYPAVYLPLSDNMPASMLTYRLESERS